MNPNHDCKDGKFHMCKDCYENASVMLKLSNSRIVATDQEHQGQSHVVRSDEYHPFEES